MTRLESAPKIPTLRPIIQGSVFGAIFIPERFSKHDMFMWQDILHFDRQLLLALNGSWGFGWDTFFYWVSNIPFWIPFYILLLFFVWRRSGWRGLLLVLLVLGATIGLTDQICNFFKMYTPKFRPSHNPDISQWVYTVRGYLGGPYGTVSGHSAISFTIAMFTGLFFRKFWFSIFIFCWAALIAYSRIYLGVHFPMDIFFGTCLGLIMGYCSYKIHASLYRRFSHKPR